MRHHKSNQHCQLSKPSGSCLTSCVALQLEPDSIHTFTSTVMALDAFPYLWRSQYTSWHKQCGARRQPSVVAGQCPLHGVHCCSTVVGHARLTRSTHSSTCPAFITVPYELRSQISPDCVAHTTQPVPGAHAHAHSRTRARTHARTRAWACPHARMHAHTHTRTH
jgi:hypothetical protein